MRLVVKGLALWVGFLLGFLGVTGCRQDHDDAAQTAEKALGVEAKEKTTADVKRDVIVIKETKVVDAKTGQTLSDEKKATPVTIEKKTKEEVNVKTGETEVSPKK